MAGVYNAVWRSLWSLYLDGMSPGQHLAVMATAGDHRGHSTSTWTPCHLANTWRWWRRPEITVVALPGRHVTWPTPGSDGDGRSDRAGHPRRRLLDLQTSLSTFRQRLDCRRPATRYHFLSFYQSIVYFKKITRAENEDFLHFLKHGNRALELGGTSWHLLRDGLLYSRRPPSRTQRSQNDATGRYPAHDDAVTSLAASPF